MKLVVVFAIAAFLATVAAEKKKGKACTGSNECLDDDEGRTLCRDVGGELHCVECGDDGDCAPNEFCTTSRISGVSGYDDADKGMCLKYDQPLGKPCDVTIGLGDVVKDENNKLYCGLITEYEDGPGDTQVPVQAQWSGSCINKKCEMCNVGQLSATENRRCHPKGTVGSAGTYQSYTLSGSGRDFAQNFSLQLLLLILIGQVALTFHYCFTSPNGIMNKFVRKD